MRNARWKLCLTLSVLMLGPAGGTAKADLYAEALSQLNRGNYVEARSRFIAMAERGNPQAQFQLGLMYHRGRGLPQNYRNAAKWYRLAARQNDADASNNLGVLYRDGLGVEGSKVLAYMWFSLSASEKNGGGLGRKNRDELAIRMSPEDILQAQQLAEEYAVDLREESRRRLARIDAAKKARTLTPESKTETKPTMVAALPTSKVKRGHDAGASVIEARSSDQPNAAEEWIKKRIQEALAFLDPTAEKKDGYVVQLGLFRNAGNVERVQDKLRDAGIDVKVEQVRVSGTQYQRLRAGPYASKQEAMAMATRFDDMFKIKTLLMPVTF